MVQEVGFHETNNDIIPHPDYKVDKFDRPFISEPILDEESNLVDMTSENNLNFDFRPRSNVGEKIAVKATFEPDYKDPVSGPFTYYVKPRFIYDKLEDISELEDPSVCYKRLMNTYPILSYHMDSEPSQDTIEAEYKDDGRTVYQVEICKMKNGITSKKTLGRHRVQLPEDWGEIPLTTQRAGYRDVRKLATWDLKPKAIIPPKAALDPNMKERAILKVRTGESEYEGKIGRLGGDIVKDVLYGPYDDYKHCKIHEALRKKRLIREEFRKH